MYIYVSPGQTHLKQLSIKVIITDRCGGALDCIITEVCRTATLNTCMLQVCVTFVICVYMYHLTTIYHLYTFNIYVLRRVYSSGSQSQSTFCMFLLSLQRFVLFNRKCPAKWT